MTSDKKEFKRHFPVIDKCLCCFCMNLEVAIKISTIILIIIHGLAILGSNDIFSMAYSICIVISLIFLLIGIENKNISYMKQFIYVYLVGIVISIILLVLIILAFFFFKETIDEYIYGDAELDDDVSYEQLETMSTTIFSIFVIIDIIWELFNIYYYIVTSSYIEQCIEDSMYAEMNRNIENNSY